MKITRLTRMKKPSGRISHGPIPAAFFFPLSRHPFRRQTIPSLPETIAGRSRPAVIATGELMSGAEAEDLMYLLATGHPGTLYSAGGAGVKDGFKRLEALLKGRSS